MRVDAFPQKRQPLARVCPLDRTINISQARGNATADSRRIPTPLLLCTPASVDEKRPMVVTAALQPLGLRPTARVRRRVF
jgi:hypothetical protein